MGASTISRQHHVQCRPSRSRSASTRSLRAFVPILVANLDPSYLATICRRAATPKGNGPATKALARPPQLRATRRAGLSRRLQPSSAWLSVPTDSQDDHCCCHVASQADETWIRLCIRLVIISRVLRGSGDNLQPHRRAHNKPIAFGLPSPIVATPGYSRRYSLLPPPASLPLPFGLHHLHESLLIPQIMNAESA